MVLKNLRRARTLRRLTQGDLAQLVGCRQQVVSDFERGLLPPSVELVTRIAEALEMSPDALCGRRPRQSRG